MARELAASGAELIAVDIDEAKVNAATAVIPVCKCADITDPDVIRQLGIGSIDVVIIAMADNLEACVMAVTLCKEAGVKTVIAKCGSEMHQKILTRVGADMVVFPEEESGVRLAKNLLSSGFVDMLTLSKDFSMIELGVKPEWVGKGIAIIDGIVPELLITGIHLLKEVLDVSPIIIGVLQRSRHHVIGYPIKFEGINMQTSVS